MTDCPNHEGAYDCTPFCPLCEGEQEIKDPEWKPNKFMHYRYISDYAVVSFTVAGMDDWDEDRFDDASMFDLRSYVLNAEDYWLDDCEEVLS
jgi:hypothetical protein